MKALFCNLKPILAYWAAFLIYFALHIFSIMYPGAAMSAVLSASYSFSILLPGIRTA